MPAHNHGLARAGAGSVHPPRQSRVTNRAAAVGTPACATFVGDVAMLERPGARLAARVEALLRSSEKTHSMTALSPADATRPIEPPALLAFRNG